MIIHLAFQRAVDHDPGQTAQQLALAGQLRPLGAGLLRQLLHQVRVRPGHPDRGLLIRHVRHSVSSFLRSYTVEITVPGLGLLIAPVRPSWKDRYPLIPIAEYAAWRRADGLPFDPWM